MRYQTPAGPLTGARVNEEDLFDVIEMLRSELLTAASQRSLTDHAVVELSERLDLYIVQAQERMLEKRRDGKPSGRAPGSRKSGRKPFLQ